MPKWLTIVGVRDPSSAALANAGAEHAGESLLRDLGKGNRCQSQNGNDQQSLGHGGREGSEKNFVSVI